MLPASVSLPICCCRVVSELTVVGNALMAAKMAGSEMVVAASSLILAIRLLIWLTFAVSLANSCPLFLIHFSTSTKRFSTSVRFVTAVSNSDLMLSTVAWSALSAMAFSKSARRLLTLPSNSVFCCWRSLWVLSKSPSIPFTCAISSLTWELNSPILVMSFSVMAVWSAATVSCKSFTACASALPAVNSLMSSCNAAWASCKAFRASAVETSTVCFNASTCDCRLAMSSS